MSSGNNLTINYQKDNLKYLINFLTTSKKEWQLDAQGHNVLVHHTQGNKIYSTRAMQYQY